MGTDIHMIAQKRNDAGGWENIEPPEAFTIRRIEVSLDDNDDDSFDFDHWSSVMDDTWFIRRNYGLFALLADVRNGYGFDVYGGHDPITPISKPRGFPSDARDLWPLRDVAHHSFSWLNVDELKHPEGVIRKGALVSEDDFKLWDGGRPDRSFEWVVGDNVKMIDPETMHEIWDGTRPRETGAEYYVGVSWVMPTREFTDDRGLFDALRAAGAERIVFGFDS